MPNQREIAREISYASSARTRAGRALIRTVENSTGRLRLIRRVSGYERDVAAGRDFWEVMADRYGLTLDIVGGSLANIPATGPVIAVANHPYGILDGLMMGFILSTVRGGDFRILAHRVFRRAAELDKIILPISFDETKEALSLNVQTRKDALAYLKIDGAIGVFPGGTVATAVRPFAQPMDPLWRGFTAKMIAKSDAVVVPIYFDGQNSRMFQIASHLHSTLRMALLIKEFRKRVDTPVRVVIGEPITRARLAEFDADPRGCMDFLRGQTYGLSPRPLDSLAYGYEFEEKHRR